jgi:hypothetical protein
VRGIDAVNGDISISAGSSLSASEWYTNIIFYFEFGQFPNGMSSKERRALAMCCFFIRDDIVHEYIIIEQMVTIHEMMHPLDNK